MSENRIYQNKDYLRDSQYKNSQNLNARATIHERFSTATTNWFEWVLQHAALRENMKVLEVGGGPGLLWRNNLARLPKEIEITITDFSPGMVAEAEAALGDNNGRFRFQVVNIEEIPFADNSFDLVIGNHMLYHVPNLAKGLQEVGRVLKPNGRFLAATNGANHMKELRELFHSLFADVVTQTMLSREAGELPFSLENGRSLLEPWFATVTCHLFGDGLIVDEAEPLLNYMLSSQAAREMATPELRERARQQLNSQIKQNGAIHIQKSTCLFVTTVE